MSLAEFEAFLCRLNGVDRIEDLRPEACLYWQAFFTQLYVYSMMTWDVFLSLLPPPKFDPP